MSLMERLRDETRPLHEALERTDFGRALTAGAATREGYVAYLQAVGTIYDELEREPLPPPAGAVWRPDMARTDVIARDLEALDAEQRPSTLTASGAQAIVAAQWLRMQRRRAPARLVGALYVLEGSALGGAVIAGPMAEAIGLGGAGVEYLRSRDGAIQARWRAFKERVDALDPALHDTVIDGARETFRAFRRLFEAIVAVGDPMAQMLNEEAGTHAITRDPAELEAALRAGERSLADFPYLLARFGARGERFTRSDSAWLVTLCQLRRARVMNQIHWLGVVLASRGMPRLLLEKHLRHLRDALVDGVGPEPRFELLREAADDLRGERHEVLPAEAFDDLVERFRSRAPEPELSALPDVPGLLVGAVTDEANGIRRAVESLLDWLADRERHSAQWIRAVRDTVEEGRASAR